MRHDVTGYRDVFRQRFGGPRCGVRPQVHKPLVFDQPDGPCTPRTVGRPARADGDTGQGAQDRTGSCPMRRPLRRRERRTTDGCRHGSRACRLVMSFAAATHPTSSTRFDPVSNVRASASGSLPFVLQPIREPGLLNVLPKILAGVAVELHDRQASAGRRATSRRGSTGPTTR